MFDDLGQQADEDLRKERRNQYLVCLRHDGNWLYWTNTKSAFWSPSMVDAVWTSFKKARAVADTFCGDVIGFDYSGNTVHLPHYHYGDGVCYVDSGKYKTEIQRDKLLAACIEAEVLLRGARVFAKHTDILDAVIKQCQEAIASIKESAS